MSSSEPVKKIILLDQDKQLIRLIRQTKSGELRIIVEKGLPTRVEAIKRGIEL